MVSGRLAGFLIVLLIAKALQKLVALALAKLAERSWGDSPMGKMLATAIPALVLGIAVFMILNQLRIATDIVVITYAALMGAVALGAALAFGLGGRDVASRMLEQAYRRGQPSGRAPEPTAGPRQPKRQRKNLLPKEGPPDELGGEISRWPLPKRRNPALERDFARSG